MGKGEKHCFGHCFDHCFDHRFWSVFCHIFIPRIITPFYHEHKRPWAQAHPGFCRPGNNAVPQGFVRLRDVLAKKNPNCLQFDPTKHKVCDLGYTKDQVQDMLVSLMQYDRLASWSGWGVGDIEHPRPHVSTTDLWHPRGESRRELDEIADDEHPNEITTPPNLAKPQGKQVAFRSYDLSPIFAAQGNHPIRSANNASDEVVRR